MFNPFKMLGGIVKGITGGGGPMVKVEGVVDQFGPEAEQGLKWFLVLSGGGIFLVLGALAWGMVLFFSWMFL